MEIFKLFGRILIDSNEAENSMQKTDSKARQLAGVLGTGIKTAAKWGAAMVAGATAVAGAMVAAARGTAEAADAVDKASIRMGISAEKYQELAYAAGLSGVEMSTLEEAAKKLNGTDLDLTQAIAQLQAIEDDGERSAAAIEMFGEQAYQLTPLLNAGTEGMAAMKQEAHDLGLVMSNESVSSGAAMNDMFSKLDQTFGMVKNTIMVELMPYVISILEWCVENLPVIAETVRSVMSKLMPIISPVLESVGSLFKGVFALINGDTQTFADEFANIWVNLSTLAVDLGKSIIQGLWNGLQSAWKWVSDWVSEKVDWLVDKLTFWDNGTKQMAYAGAGSGTYSAYNAGVPSTNASSSQNIDVTLNIDGQQLARMQYSQNKAEAARRGQSYVNK